MQQVEKLTAQNTLLEQENSAMRDQLDDIDTSPHALAAENEVLRDQLDTCTQDRTDLLEPTAQDPQARSRTTVTPVAAPCCAPLSTAHQADHAGGPGA